MGRRPAPCGTVTRYKRGCRCDGCVAAYRVDYDANRQQIVERVAAWKKANPERHRAVQARHRERTREKRRADSLARYHRLMAEDPESVRRQRRDWLKTPKGVMANRFAAHRRRGVKPTPDAVAYAEILLRDPCSYCGAPATELDHVTPVALGGDGDWTNLTAACRSSNASKNDHTLLAFLARSA